MITHLQVSDAILMIYQDDKPLGVAKYDAYFRVWRAEFTLTCRFSNGHFSGLTPEDLCQSIMRKINA